MIPNTGTAAAPNNRNMKALFKSCTPFIDCISETNIARVYNVKYINVVMPMYNFIEYSDNYPNTSVNLDYGNIVEFKATNASISWFKLKEKVAGQIGNNGTLDFEIMVTLKYLRSFGEPLKCY